MRYFDVHEQVYRQMRSKGQSNWDVREDDAYDFENFCMRPFLEEALSRLSPQTPPKTALDIGCGTGPASSFLCARGMLVRGIDVSPTAIEIAREIAVRRGQSIQFDVADICAFDGEEALYDVVVDSHCLHCIVLENDRQAAFRAIRRSLAPSGSLLYESMAWNPQIDFSPHCIYQPDYVVMLRMIDHDLWPEAQMQDGHWCIPHRWIPPAATLIDELKSAGFEICHQNVVEQEPGEPDMVQIIASVRVV